MNVFSRALIVSEGYIRMRLVAWVFSSTSRTFCENIAEPILNEVSLLGH
jgi:hypothetical protein